MSGILVVICASLSLIGQVLMITCFIAFKKLREGLFPRIILYLTLTSAIQTIGILFSSTNYQFCGFFATLRLYGGLGCIMWSSVLMYCVRQLFGVLDYGDAMDQLKDKIKYLHALEWKFGLACFGLPMLLIIWPVCTSTIYKGDDQQYCYMYASEESSDAGMIQVDFQKVLFWELPIILYFVYSFICLNRIKELFKTDDENKYLNHELSYLIKKLVLFPIITLICTVLFTIEDIESIFTIDVPSLQTTISFAFLSFWGFLNCIAYLSQDVVQEQLRSIFKKNERSRIPESLLTEDDLNLRLSIGSQFYYYKEDGRSFQERQLQFMQQDAAY